MVDLLYNKLYEVFLKPSMSAHGTARYARSSTPVHQNACHVARTPHCGKYSSHAGDL